MKATEAAARRAGRGSGVPVQTMPNERALLSLFFQKLQQEDPDVLVAHNLMGFDFDILLSRAVHLKLATWSKVGGWVVGWVGEWDCCFVFVLVWGVLGLCEKGSYVFIFVKRKEIHHDFCCERDVFFPVLDSKRC